MLERILRTQAALYGVSPPTLTMSSATGGATPPATAGPTPDERRTERIRRIAENSAHTLMATCTSGLTPLGGFHERACALAEAAEVGCHKIASTLLEAIDCEAAFGNEPKKDECHTMLDALQGATEPAASWQHSFPTNNNTSSRTKLKEFVAVLQRQRNADRDAAHDASHKLSKPSL